MSLYPKITLLAATAALVVGCSPSQPEPSAVYPEAATGFADNQLVTSENYMVSAANPYAVQAGTEILAAGGSAIDAAVAVQTMLTLVEPQSSGIGGGGFILYWDAETEQLHTLDARETAPAAADHELFLDQDGQPERWIDAVVGGRSVGTPGIVRGLAEVHNEWGRLPWERLFASTIERSEQGFTVSPRLAQLVEMEINPGVRKMSAAADYFFPQGEPIQAGSLKRNPELAESLRQIARQGPDAFYQGPLAEQMVAAVNNAEIEPGYLSLQDLSEYQVAWREPVCMEYRQQEVCSMGPPSSGGIAVLQTLKMLERYNLADYSPDDEQVWHWFSQATRLAFADRDRYLADPDFVDVPVAELMNPEYLQQRSQLIGEQDMGQAQAGDFNDYVAGLNYEQPSTTHISIVDAQGNAVSITSSIEMGFGSAVMAGGFLLNNQLTDFSLNPYPGEGLAANQVEPGKRPRSSMSPVITFDSNGDLRHVLGSPGGPRIINYVSKTLVGLIDFELDMQAAIDLPNVSNLNSASTSIEETLVPLGWEAAFNERGYDVEVRSLNSGLHGISVIDGRLYGGADPRREGVAAGQ